MVSQSAVNFTIANPFITVTAPNTAVTWDVGTTQTITFNHNLGSGVLVNMDVSRDGGATYSPGITFPTSGATTATGSWLVAGPATTQARIRVSVPGVASDASDVDFTIRWTIGLTSPNTAVTWAIGTTRSVTWTHNLGAGQLFDVDLSTDGGATYPTSVATNVAGAATNGTFDWVVSGPVSATARIRVRWVDNPSVSGQSAVNFSMADPVVTVTAPNTAVTWAVDTSQNITFNHNLGTGVVVNVDVSRDGGANYAAVTSFTTTSATTGTVPWVVTGPATTQARIRVSWNGIASDASDVDFTIQ